MGFFAYPSTPFRGDMQKPPIYVEETIEYVLGGLHFEVAQQFRKALLIDRIILPVREVADVSALT